MKNIKNLNLKILKYFTQKSLKHKWGFLGSFIFLGIGILIDSVFIPFLYKELVDTLVLFSTNNFEIIKKSKFIILEILLLFLFSQTTIWRIRHLFANNFKSKTIKEITDDCFIKIHQKSPKFFSDNFVGALVTKTKRFYTGFENITNIFLYGFANAFYAVLYSIIILYFIAPIFSIIIIIWFFIFIIINILFSHWKIKFDLVSAKTDSDVSADLADSFTNSSSIKMFSQILYESKNFFKITSKKQKSQRKAWDLNQIFEIISGILLGVVEFFLIFYAIKLYSKGEISLGTIILILSFSKSILERFWNFGEYIKELYNAFAESSEMMKIMLSNQEIIDKENCQICKIKSGNIEFKNVTFSYGKDINIFKKFNLKIKSGEKIGLVGYSGSGKTTFTKLLLRFTEINKGEILIDNQNIQNIKQDDLRKNISYIPQEPILFHRTIFENIRYGNLSLSKDKIIEIAKKSYAHHFIIEKLKGYQTIVGERGIKLSGGEKQRIAIARAMIKNAPIVILDEATSSLDSDSERHIQKSIYNFIKDKTAIIVAHRLSTIREVDRIIVFDKGKIVEDGSFNELIEKNGVFKKMWKLQKLS